LSIVFQKGTFATLDYNFRGWSDAPMFVKPPS
jgi:hypothetical protein